MSIRKKQTLQIAAEFILIVFWCVFLKQSDSYTAPYIFVGALAMYGHFTRIKTDSSAPILTTKFGKIATHVYTVALASAVVLANYKLFLGLSKGGIIACKDFLCVVLIFVGGFIVFKEILYGALRLKSIKSNPIQPNRGKTILVMLSCIMILEYLTVLFGAKYPGLLTPDSISQMNQLLSGSYSNHHPYYHTQIIHGAVSVGLTLFGDINKAVALYSVFSILIMTLCFMYIVQTIYACTDNRKFALGAYLFYLIMPFHIMYSMTMWKDVFFGAAVTCFAVSCYRCLQSIGNQKINYIVLLSTSMGMTLLRSNGWIAFLIATIVFFFLFNKNHKKIILLFIFVLLFSFVLKHPVLSLLHVPQPGLAESLSIPAQQIARVIADKRPLTNEQAQLLGKVIDIEKIPRTYKPWISDPIKGLLGQKRNQNYIREHVFDFAKLYMQLGVRYPQKYAEAWIDQTKGYWNGGYSYWRWAGGVHKNSLGIRQTVKSKTIDKIIKTYLKYWERTSVLQLFLSIGLYVWGIVIISYRALIRKDKITLFSTIPFLAVIASLLIATPVYSEFRYAYAIFCGFPFLIAITLSKSKQ